MEEAGQIIASTSPLSAPVESASNIPPHPTVHPQQPAGDPANPPAYPQQPGYPANPPSYPQQLYGNPASPPAYPQQLGDSSYPPAYPQQQNCNSVYPPAYPQHPNDNPASPPAYPQQLGDSAYPPAYPQQIIINGNSAYTLGTQAITVATVVDQPEPSTRSDHPQPPTYFPFTVFNTICCCFLLGIFAKRYGAQVIHELERGNYEEAKKASKKARNFNFASYFTGVAIWTVAILIGGIAAYFYLTL